MRYKFRAYHKKKERLVDVLEIDFENNVVTLTIETDGDDEYYWWSSTCHLDEVELMQYTGLTDKKGREIYEGDILRLLNSEVLCEVIYEAPSFCRRWISPKVNSLRGVEMESMAHNTYIEYEVIGNICEHKHLLKEKEK